MRRIINENLNSDESLHELLGNILDEPKQINNRRIIPYKSNSTILENEDPDFKYLKTLINEIKQSLNGVVELARNNTSESFSLRDIISSLIEMDNNIDNMKEMLEVNETCEDFINTGEEDIEFYNEFI